MIPVSTAAQILELGTAIMGGALTAADIGRRIASIGLDVVPVEDLQQYLSDEAARRADLLVDLAEAEKFRP